jgi:hypothetical protein
MERSIQYMKLSNFINPKVNTLPTVREITYDPTNVRQSYKARLFRSRADNIGIHHETVRVPGGKKLILSGPHGFVLKVLNSSYRGTNRRVHNTHNHRATSHKSHSHRATTRRRNRF